MSNLLKKIGKRLEKEVKNTGLLQRIRGSSGPWEKCGWILAAGGYAFWALQPERLAVKLAIPVVAALGVAAVAATSKGMTLKSLSAEWEESDERVAFVRPLGCELSELELDEVRQGTARLEAQYEVSTLTRTRAKSERHK